MNQTKLESFIEVACTTAIKYFSTLIIWLTLVPVLFDVEMSLAHSMGINLMFTVWSIVLSYVMRRFFNNGFHKRIHLWIIKSSS